VDTLLLAVLGGLVVSVPPGPLGALCVTQTLHVGLRAGLLVGLAVASGDALLGGVAAMGAEAVSGLPGWVRRTAAAVVACALFWIGVRMFRRAGEPPRTGTIRSSSRTAGTAFLLAVSTPGTLPALLVVFATFAVKSPGPAVAGVFLGGFFWWSVLCLIAHRLRNHAQTVLGKIDYACGALLWLGAAAAAHVALFA
jgi:threonine/homoserine/homoserine lactone efflux protein